MMAKKVRPLSLGEILEAEADDEGLWCLFNLDTEEPLYFRTEEDATLYAKQHRVPNHFIFGEGRN